MRSNVMWSNILWYFYQYTYSSFLTVCKNSKSITHIYYYSYYYLEILLAYELVCSNASAQYVANLATKPKWNFCTACLYLSPNVDVSFLHYYLFLYLRILFCFCSEHCHTWSKISKWVSLHLSSHQNTII